jgi:uncharacterized membrane protein
MSGNEQLALLAILVMAAVTYLTRISGFWLMGHLPLTRRMRRALEALPGSVIAATVLPTMINLGAPAIVAIAVVLLVMLGLRNDLVALAAGVGAGVLMRAGGF